MLKLMTPGPTQVLESVRLARSRVTGNPDLDLDFLEFYRETCQLISKLLGTQNETLILSGEGILGLEAACATLTQPGDRVLVLDNGLFGKGFADFVSIYGGEPVLYTADYRETLDPVALEEFLKEDHDFAYATLVHCDTPSGMKNHIDVLCPLLKQYGILTVVDSVAAMFGEPVEVDAWQIDLLCGGSQKAVSAPPGLSFVTISDQAWKVMKNRKTPVAAFYANLLIFATYYEDKWFPYTIPISDIYGLRAALDAIAADPQMTARHQTIAAACRRALQEGGLSLWQNSGFCATVTAFQIPQEVDGNQLLDLVGKNFGVQLAGSFGDFAEKVIRIGHMGANANIPDMTLTMLALDRSLRQLGIPLACSLEDAFRRNLP